MTEILPVNTRKTGRSAVHHVPLRHWTGGFGKWHKALSQNENLSWPGIMPPGAHG
jgi:hypothetical protein